MAATVDARECRRLVRTLRRWEDEILAFYTTGGITNARTEATNLGIKAIKRAATGLGHPGVSTCTEAKRPNDRSTGATDGRAGGAVGLPEDSAQWPHGDTMMICGWLQRCADAPRR